KRQNDDYNAIMAKALGDRIAEAFAELMHQRIRKVFGADESGLTMNDLIKERYQGIRPAPGYPACPDHTEKLKIWQILDAESHTGVRLTESLAMTPASSVSGYYFASPHAAYFRVGQIDRDQLSDYA